MVLLKHVTQWRQSQFRLSVNSLQGTHAYREFVNPHLVGWMLWILYEHACERMLAFIKIY